MANAYSHLHNYAQDLYTPHFDLIGQVLQYKQGKLDKNRSKLQNLSDKLALTDVAKEEDQEYLEQRLGQAVDIANKYAALDLSNDGLANDLIGKLTTVVDENVKNAVLSTRVFRAEQKDWAKLEEEEPEFFNAGNKRYAQQGANNWLNDGTVGQKYNGGGGVIRYDDYHKRWQEAIPDIAKYLGAEYSVQENGQGIFIDNVTKTQVERSKLSSAMDEILGEKGMQQQAISAWNKYDGRDPNEIKAEYDAYLAPKVARVTRDIKTLKNIIPGTQDKVLKAKYEAQLKDLTASRNSYKSNSFDELAKRGERGIESAYQKMFSEGEKEGLLHVYAYTPREISRVADDNHVKTLNFQEKVRHNLQTEATALAKAGGGKKGSGLQQYDKNGNPTVVVAGEGFTKAEDKVSDLTATQTENAEGFSALKSVVGNLSHAELIGIGSQLDNADLGKSSVTVNVGGEAKKIEFFTKDINGNYVSNGNRAKLLEFKSKTWEDSSYERKYKKILKGGVKAMQLKLSEEVKLQPDFLSEVPVVGKRVVRTGGTDEEPIYGVETMSQDDATSYFQGLLLKKESGEMTAEEQLTLDMQVYNLLASDSALEDQDATAIFAAMRQEMVPKIGFEAFNQIATSAQDLRDVHNDLRRNKDYYGSIDHRLYEGLNAAAETMPGSTFGVMKTARDLWLSVSGGLTDLLENEEYELSDMGLWDSESSGQTVEGATRGLYSDLHNIKDDGGLVNPIKYAISETDSRYAAIADYLEGQTGKAPSGAISLSAEANTGQEDFSGNVHFSYKESGKEGGLIRSYDDEGDSGAEIFAPIPGSVLAQYNLPIISKADTRYKGSDGDNALKVPLGSSELEKPMLRRINAELKKEGRSLVMYDMDNVNATLDAANAISPERKLQAANAMKGYLKGGYSFELASNDMDRQYNMVLYQDGVKEPIYAFPLDRDFTDSELADFMDAEAHYYKQAVFSSYVNNEILESQVIGALDAAVVDVETILNQAIKPN